MKFSRSVEASTKMIKHGEVMIGKNNMMREAFAEIK
jgi:hypothetical protein